MVAVMEVSEDMADKTRKALAEAAPYVSTPVFVEVAQFFDRLSPPAPEVDEATVWTRKVLMARAGGFSSDTEWQSAAVCQAIAELIASKDAEIERLRETADKYKWQVRDTCTRAEKAEAELAAISAAIGTTEFMGPPDGGSPTLAEQVGRMRAEIERLRGLRYGDLEADAKDYRAACEAAEAQTERACSDLDITNADRVALWIERNTIPDEPMNQCASWLACRIVEAHESELAALRAANERLKDTLNTLGTRWALRKAAERNTAGPLVSLASGEPKIGGWTSDAKYAPNEPAKTHVWPATHDDACSEIKATETTPDVVVTQADCQREQWARNIASYTEGQARNHVYECAINLLTEAEARGRLEALEEIKKWLRSPEGKGSDAGIDYADGFADQIELMMTGGK